MNLADGESSCIVSVVGLGRPETRCLSSQTTLVTHGNSTRLNSKMHEHGGTTDYDPIELTHEV